MGWGGVWWRVWILPGWGETRCVVWGEEEEDDGQYLLVPDTYARHGAKCFLFSLIFMPIWWGKYPYPPFPDEEPGLRQVVWCAQGLL